MKLVLLVISLFYFDAVCALERVKILRMSKTGKTIILDKGRLEGVRPGDKARLMFQVGVDKPKLQYLAQAQVVQINDDYSFWYLSKINSAQVITVGQLVTLVEQKESMAGRELKIRKKKVILPSGKTIVQYMHEEEVGMPDELVYKGQEYVKGHQLVETDILEDEHLEVREFDKWKLQHGMEYVDDYMQSVEKKFLDAHESEVDMEKIAQQHDQEVFESMVAGVAAKYNKLEHGLQGLYREQKRDQDIGFITDKVQIENLYEKAHRKKKENQTVEPFAQAKIDRNPGRWSSDLDSEELRRFFVQSGIDEEKRRQELALDSIEGHEILIRISSGLVNLSTADDSENQGTGYSVGLGYEYHLSRATKSLERFSLEIGLEQAVRYLDLGGINGHFTESSFYGGVNFYLFNRPHNVKKHLWYVGAGLRRGSATVDSESLSQDYTFQFLSVPVLQAGVKYRFHAGDERDDAINIGLGYNILVSSELLQYAVNETLADNIDSLVKASDTRIFAGLSVYF